MDHNVNNENIELFSWNGKPSLGKTIPISLQHIFTMLAGNVTPAIIIAGTLGMTPEESTTLLQASMLAAAIATFIQVIGVWKFGARLPIIMGINFYFVPVVIAITEQFGISAMFGAQIIAGVATIAFGGFVRTIRNFFPAVVTGTTVLTIGVSLFPVAVNYMAGNAGSPGFGSMQNWAVAIATLAVVLIVDQFAKGYIKVLGVMIGMLAGYALAFVLGMVDLSGIGGSGIIQIPSLFPFGLEFPPQAVLTLVIMFIITSIENIGDISSTTIGGLDREATTDELSGGIMGNGLASVISALFGGLPTATFSQNVGVVAMTKVIAKPVFVGAAILMLIAGFLPVFSQLLLSIPYPVIGGATVSVFSMITVNGIRLLLGTELNNRNAAIIGLSLAMGIGITGTQGSIGGFPEAFVTFLGGSSVILATLVAFILNLVLPGREKPKVE